MERKNTVLLTVIGVATLLVAVVGATFAYFVASGNVNSQSTVNVTTSAVDTVSSTSTNCAVNVLASDMREGAGTSDGVVAKSGTCTLKITGTKSANNSSATICTYDITYTPNTTSPYTAVVRSTANTNNKKEISLAGTAAKTDTNSALTGGTYSETDLYSLSSKTTIVNDGTFKFSATDTMTWTFTVKVYNYNFNQNQLAGKSFGGTLKFENVSCTAAAAS